MRKDCTCTYVLLSTAFIGVNVVTLCNLAPWIDEVMMLDTAYNAAVHGSWETTAWYRVAGQYPFSTYPPLYQLLATGWIWLFGSSLVTVRSMNLLITFALGAVCLRLAERQMRLTPWTTALFTVLLWGSGEMAWTVRNGRPDMLCALLLVVALHAILHHLTTKTAATRIAVIATSALLLCSGVQAAVYLCALWLFGFLVMKGRRREVAHLFLPLLAGLLTGLLMVALFMLAHGRLTAFASSILQYSATLSAIAQAVLPWAGEVLGITVAPYVNKLRELSAESSLVERMAAITEYRSFLILAAVALAAYAVSYWGRWRRLPSDKGFLAWLLALYVPVIMHLAGRFAVYYRWMAFLPLLFSVMWIAGRSRWWLAVWGMVAVPMTGAGVRTMLPKANWDYDNLRAFVQRQHFKPSDAVVCPFMVFYEMKPVCDTCYFASIFPTEYIGHADYIIETNGDGYDRRLTGYADMLRADTTAVLTVVDRCEHPSLTLYQITTRHE